MVNKAEQTAEGHPDQAGKGVAGAERVVDERTGDKYDTRTDKAADTVRRSYRDGGTTGR